MKNVLFIDVDGTLTGFKDGKQYIPQSAKEALLASKAHGNLNVICTGRSLFELNTLGNVEDMGFDAIIGANGAYIEYNHHCIYNQIFEQKDVEEIQSKLEELNIAYYLECNDGLFWNELFERIVSYSMSEKEKKVLSSIYQPLQNCKGPVYKIAFLSSQDDYYKLEEMYSQKYGMVKTSYGNGSGGEIFNKGITKYSAIQYLLEKLQLEEVTTYGFGDSMNDKQMFEACDVKIAMGNARDGLKDLADYVTDDLDQDGLANAIHHYQL